MKELKKLVKALKNNKKVNAAILFGSQARGKAKPYSDIDICIITKGNISRQEQEDILANSSNKIDISLLQDLPESIKYRVFKEGKILFSKDKNMLNRAKNLSIRSYFDFRPLIEKYTRRILRGI